VYAESEAADAPAGFAVSAPDAKEVAHSNAAQPVQSSFIESSLA
jgi:hypothetical protein